ncbi:MAG: hypothetical protein KDJ65_12640, partial [Anaerolineae bacterium]|nr:hypothetical protein [Anaerolineae bacterium]
LATIFSANSADSPRLYRADLLGAGLGAIGAIPVMNAVGSLNSLFLVSALFGVAALMVDLLKPVGQAADLPQPEPISDVFYEGKARQRRSAIAAGLLCGLSAVALVTNALPATRWLEVDMGGLAAAKPITDSLAEGGTIIRTTWDSFARTDLVDPGQGRPYELYLDGAAGSVMPPEGDLNLLRTDIGFFPFATNQPEQVLVVGPGGGLDVWFALNGRAQSVTAVEINPASVDIVNALAAYHGNLYHQPGVRVLVDEGRSVLRREDRRYDLIYLSQVVTLAAERSGYALTENTIYTVEAFSDYLAHLQPGGQIALKLYDELTLTRALVTAATALAQTRGIAEAEAMSHLAVFLDPDADPPVPLLLIQAEPFAPGDAQAYADIANQVGFTPLFVPGVTASPALAGLLNGETSLADLIAASTSDITPTTDDRPFFYQFERGVPQRLQPLVWGMGGLLVCLVVGWVVGLFGGWFDGVGGGKTAARWMPLYFAALGAGFMLVETALIQQTRLFLGHPTLAVTTMLGVLLIGGGIGSGWAGRWPDVTKSRRLLGVLVVVVALVVVWLLAWPWLSEAFRAASTGGRMVVATAGVLPLALLMGIPFPLGLWLAGRFEHGDRHVALAWAVNGVMTVAGSLVAVTLAMLVGFGWVLLVGAGMYGLAAGVAYVVRR